MLSIASFNAALNSSSEWLTFRSWERAREKLAIKPSYSFSLRLPHPLNNRRKGPRPEEHLDGQWFLYKY